ncbi:GlcG/HbpS family heme-binding protein [Psychrobacter pygoscelis]|uniref:GlcG/HbpS family heme-binding protein n=1 Tax=Psychrobacter pygoscelis TaxID=2488563 RepID=UPI00103ABD8F|nr:heme-binding protein [Psychrobacter pygoscelis]
MRFNSKLFNLSALAAITALTVTAQAAPTSSAKVPATVTQTSISSEAALQVAKRAVDQCKSDGYSVTATVVDAAGTPLVQFRNENAGPHTLNSSYHKAFTAVSLKQPTTKYADMIEKNPKLDPLRDMDSRLLLLGGGLPIKIGDTIIGGVGVGGAPGAHLDEACANAGLSIIK